LGGGELRGGGATSAAHFERCCHDEPLLWPPRVDRATGGRLPSFCSGPVTSSHISLVMTR
jgi:hypothetical protein